MENENNEADIEFMKEKVRDMAELLIETGARSMPVLIHLNVTAAEFMEEMTSIAPPDGDPEQENWKRKYALGVIKRAYPSLLDELNSLPDIMRGDMAVTILEKQIMPALSAEIRPVTCGGLSSVMALIGGMQAGGTRTNQRLEQKSRRMFTQPRADRRKNDIEKANTANFIALGKRLGISESRLQQLLGDMKSKIGGMT